MKTILAVFIILATATAAHAKSVLIFSIEYNTDGAAAIGVYTVTDPGKKMEGKYPAYALSLALQEKIKGEPPAEWKSQPEYFAMAPGVPLETDLAVGDRFLMFFRRDAKGVLQADGPVCLTGPAVFNSVAGLAVNAKFELLTNEKAILDAVRDRMKAHPDAAQIAPAGEAMWERAIGIPEDTALYKRIWEGSGCSLILPEDLAAPYRARNETRAIAEALRQYYDSKHSIPSGGSGKIVEMLMNSSARRGEGPFLRISSEEEKKFNKTGKYFDPWGTPYRIDVSDPKSPKAWSCGPDKIDNSGAAGSDDIVSW